MELTINGKDYPLYFGFAFIDYMNKHNGMDADGLKMNVGGMMQMNAGLSMKSPSTLRLIIKGGTDTLKGKPSNTDIDNYIEELLEDEEAYDELFAEIGAEIKKSRVNRKEMGLQAMDKA